MRLRILDDSIVIKPFDCGDSDLNEFLLFDARYYMQQMFANTYIIEDETQTVAYYSLLNDKISNTAVPKNIWRKLRKTIPHEKHFSSYPAVKIGRLAVSLNYREKGLGTQILDAVKQMFVKQTLQSASRFITVDAYHNAVPFYQKNGFKTLVNDMDGYIDTVPMYYDLKQLA